MDFTKDQRSLLLYLETCAVDASGRVNGKRMNQDDFRQAAVWNNAGFIRFGRIASECVNQYGAHWVEFTDAAWQAVHAERRARAERLRARRTFRTTEEKRESEFLPVS